MCYFRHFSQFKGLTHNSVGNPSIQVYHGPESCNPRQKSPSDKVLKSHSIEPIALASKEHLGIVNGTAVSAAVAALAIDDAIHLALLAQVCTAMGTEALNGTRGSYAAFIHAVARPHPGQVCWGYFCSYLEFLFALDLRWNVLRISGTFCEVASSPNFMKRRLLSRKTDTC